MAMISKKCQHCGKTNQFDTSNPGGSFYCSQCGERCDLENVAGNTEEPSLDSDSSVKKAEGRSEPHAGGSGSSTTDRNSRHRPSIADLRNQCTINVGGAQPTMVKDDETEGPFSRTVEKITFSLPFAAGEFLATEVLAQGGMSTTYTGYRCSNPEEKVVIKVPDVRSKKTVEMFGNECKILAELKHPNIVPILSSGEFSMDGKN